MAKKKEELFFEWYIINANELRELYTNLNMRKDPMFDINKSNREIYETQNRTSPLFKHLVWPDE